MGVCHRTYRIQKYYFSVVGVRDEYELSQIISKICLSAIQELMTEIETGIHRAGEGAEVIISFTEVGDLVVTIKDVSNPETPVITKVFTAGAGMTPILPGKFGKWVGDKVDRGVKWVWKKVSGVWKRSPRGLVNVVEEPADRLGRWFARYGDDGAETFSARLLNGTDELSIGWTDNVRQLAGNIAEIQGAIGRNIQKISGTASDGLLKTIKAGRFNTGLYARHLSRNLGGTWQIDVIQRNPNKWEIIATRIGG